MNDHFESAFSKRLDRSEVLWKSRPQPNFPSISITGEECELNCEYCEGRYLRNMIYSEEPEDLLEICLSLDSKDARGALLSGGYNKEGYIPFEPFVDAIACIKEETDLFLSIHSGFIPEDLARELGEAGVDEVDFELISPDETADSKFGLDKTTSDYKSSLNLMLGEFPHVAPHILLGLSRNGLQYEREALDMLSCFGVSTIVFLVIIPPPSSEEYVVPTPEEIGKFIAEARLDFPETPLALGCMRPKDEDRVDTEVQAIKGGIDRIVLPSEEAVRTAEGMGLKIRNLNACCAIPESRVKRWFDG